MRCVYGQDKSVGGFVARRIAHLHGGIEKFGAFKAVGVVDTSGRPVAGIVFHDYQPDYRTCQISMASATPMWAKPEIITELLSIPFKQYGVFKVFTIIPHTSLKVIKFNLHLGFVREGVGRHQFGKGSHAVFCGMIEPEFRKMVRRLTEPRNIQKAA